MKNSFSTEIPRFHLAFPVHDLRKARVFYAEILGCEVGRYSDKWIDFNLYGHQIVAHLSPQDCSSTKKNEVDGDHVPAKHFGVILPWDKWDQLVKILKDKDAKNREKAASADRPDRLLIRLRVLKPPLEG